MAEFVLGTGFQRSLRDIARLLEVQVRRTQGAPRRIMGNADGISFVASREKFEGKFTQFELSFDLAFEEIHYIEVLSLAEMAPYITEQTDTVLHLRFPKVEGEDPGAGIAAMDALLKGIRLPGVWRGDGGQFRVERINVELLFKAMVEYRASDVHLSPGFAPVFRVDGDTRLSEIMGPLSSVQIRELIREIADPQYWKEFETEKQTSFNFHQAGLGYSRVSAFIKSDAPHCTMRFLPETIPSFEELHVPRPTMEQLAKLHRGLLLLTGMTGSGKSTTVAALVDWINSHKSLHILTIENPIEYVHSSKKSIISQRCLGVDVANFSDAVRGALRHDPDVIVIGEMRDPDTIRSAISAAATGHLVISTLHANTASEVVNRIVSFFDPIERDLVKLQLRDALRCVINQRLVPKIGGGRVPALEILFNDVKAISTGILEGDTDHIRIGMQQTVSHSMLFEHYLYKLYQDGLIDIAHAREFATDVSMFDQIVMGTYSVPRLEGVRGGH
ncbi:MAG: PilT/PilU family type 4a pilus ATPase [Candidatus Hydrogenedentes bacterium]|nr:PilT/PilU family type 4a pilus ATPase [Candidatus Hydrogenedentota bacterium]